MSIASDILRIQNAKASLKNAINAKNKAPNLITNELIDGYAAFVRSITTNAFQVRTIEEMNAITDMVEGDYCVLQAIPTYVVPETATFTRFTGNPTDLLNGEYSNYLFLIRDNNVGGSQILTDVKEIIYSYRVDWWGCVYVGKTFTNDTLTFDIDSTTKKQVFMFEQQPNNTLAIKSLNDKYIIKEPNKDSFTNSTTNFNNVNMFINELIYNSDSQRYTVKICDASGTPYNKTFSNGYSNTTYKSCLYVGTSTNNIMLYACPMQTTTLAHQIFKYEASGWVDVTDAVLVPTTNVTPTISSQTLPIPAGYTGFKNVTVNAVDNTIDANIIAGNIKDGVSILGVTGTYIGGAHTGAYKVEGYNEMLQLTGMQDGDLCFIEDINIYPTTDVTFTKFTGNPQDLQTGVYDHALFIFKNRNASRAISDINSNDKYINNVSITITNDTVEGNKNSNYVFMIDETDDNVHRYIRFPGSKKYLWTDENDIEAASYPGYLQSSIDGTDLTDFTTPAKVGVRFANDTDEFYPITNFKKTGASNNNFLNSGKTASSQTSAQSYLTGNSAYSMYGTLYYYEMQTSGNLYQYQEGTGWVDISETGDAVATDIKEGKSAYVNGKLVEGVLPEVINPASICNAGSNFYNGQFFKPQNAISGNNRYGCYLVTGELDEYNGVQYLVNWVTVTALQSWYIQNQSKVKVGMPASIVASKIGLRPNVIKSGVTILGVTGTYTGN